MTEESKSIDITTDGLTNRAIDGSLALQRFAIQQTNLRIVHFHWVDMAGILRSRAIPLERCRRIVNGSENSIAAGAWIEIGFMLCTDLPHCCLPATKSMLHPDWSSLRYLRNGHASVMCNISEDNTDWGDPDGGRTFNRCARSMLQSLVQNIRQKHHLEIAIGIEVEFYLIDSYEGSGPPQIDPAKLYNHHSSASALRGRSEGVLVECVEELRKAGLYVEHYHAECEPHQFEISLSPMGVLEAVDGYTRMKEVITNTSAAHQMFATFLPKPFESVDTSGLHIHISFANATDAEISAEDGDHFIAGILHRLPLLCAFGMPTEDSYQRLHFMTLGDYVCWGRENRDTPIRKIGDTHWELRAFDCTANLYLALAAYLAAGSLGLAGRESLSAGDLREYQCRVTYEERQKLGIHVKLPRSLQEAMELFDRDLCGLEQVINPKLLDLYRVSKAGERAALQRMTTAARATLAFEAY